MAGSRDTETESLRKLKSLTDCLLFASGRTCKHGSKCHFRHHHPQHPDTCEKWMDKDCFNVNCEKRHPNRKAFPSRPIIKRAAKSVKDIPSFSKEPFVRAVAEPKLLKPNKLWPVFNDMSYALPQPPSYEDIDHNYPGVQPSQMFGPPAMSHPSTTASNSVEGSSAHLDTNKEEGDPIGIFWDLETCNVPSGESAAAIAKRIRDIYLPGHHEMTFMCFHDAATEKAAIGELNNVQETIITHCIPVDSKADKMTAALRRFAKNHRFPATIVLVSSDEKLSSIVKELCCRHMFNVKLVHNSQASISLTQYAERSSLFQDVAVQRTAENTAQPGQDNASDFLGKCETFLPSFSKYNPNIWKNLTNYMTENSKDALPIPTIVDDSVWSRLNEAPSNIKLFGVKEKACAIRLPCEEFTKQCCCDWIAADLHNDPHEKFQNQMVTRLEKCLSAIGYSLRTLLSEYPKNFTLEDDQVGLSSNYQQWLVFDEIAALLADEETESLHFCQISSAYHNKYRRNLNLADYGCEHIQQFLLADRAQKFQMLPPYLRLGPASLLEIELEELLEDFNGALPVASLPSCYSEKFGKKLDDQVLEYMRRTYRQKAISPRTTIIGDHADAVVVLKTAVEAKMLAQYF